MDVTMKQRICTRCIILSFLICISFTFGLEAQRDCVQDHAKVEEGRKCRKPCRSHSDCRGANKGCHCDNACGMSCFNKNATCYPPQEMHHGRVTGDNYKYGGVIEYSCNKGYTLTGRKNRTCHADRQWTGVAPICQRTCPPVSAPKHGSIKIIPSSELFIVGTKVIFMCHSGRPIGGPRIITCLKNGMWSDPIRPTCQEEWGDWTEWSSCSAPCNGFKFRARKCRRPGGILASLGCAGDSYSYAKCSTGACPAAESDDKDCNENPLLCLKDAVSGEWLETLGSKLTDLVGMFGG